MERGNGVMLYMRERERERMERTKERGQLGKIKMAPYVKGCQKNPKGLRNHLCLEFNCITKHRVVAENIKQGSMQIKSLFSS